MTQAVAAVLAAFFVLASSVRAPEPDAVRLAATVRAAVLAHFGLWDPQRRNAFELAWGRYSARLPEFALDRDSFDLETMRLMGSLRNGHSGFYDPAFWKARPVVAPFELRYAEHAWVAFHSRAEGVPDGTRLAAVNGTSAEAFFRANRDLIAASSELAARRNVLDAAFAATPSGGTAHFVFANGAVVAVDAAVSARFAERAPRLTARWAAPGIVYMAVPSFDEPAFEEDAVRTIERAWSARAVILDVRGNRGGTTPVKLMWLLATLPLPWWRESTSAPEPARPLSHGQSWPANPHAYRGRIVILADEGCVSACEDFIMPLCVSHRARLVGATTAGSTGMPYVGQLGEGRTIAAGSVREAFPDGRPFEGVGIEPTDPVPLRIADVAAHRDARAARALEIAEGRP